MVAGEYVARELKCLADDGRLAIIAVQGGTKSELDSGAVLRKRLAITGCARAAWPTRARWPARCARPCGR
jgi:NADPH:quinone reductase-like Zn-dependent oxidoreductase